MAAPGLLRRAKPLRGTLVEVQIHGGHGPRGEAALRDAFAQVERVQRLMNRHAADSDIGRFNAAPVGQAVDADPWTLEVLALAARLQRESGGAFDCDERAGAAGDPADSAPAWAVAAGALVKLRPARLDLGGIAKGYAVDRAIEALACVALDGYALVNAGGDLRHRGPRPAPVALRDPADAGRVARVHALCNEALASSCVGGLSPRPGARPRIAQRRGGQPLAHTAGASVLAPCGLLADALTKVVLLADAATRQTLLARHGARVLLGPGGGAP
jgi:thiamine biosynthesis lipoprotein